MSMRKIPHLIRTRVATETTVLANAHASATAVLKGYRDGQHFVGEILILAAGAGAANKITFSIPYTIDTTALAGGSTTTDVGRSLLGAGQWYDTGNQSEPLELAFETTTTIGFIENTQNLFGNQLANGDSVKGNFRVPIVGW
jgi:hypothetical protein